MRLKVGDHVEATKLFHKEFPTVRRGLRGRVTRVRICGATTLVKVWRDGMGAGWWAPSYWRRV